MHINEVLTAEDGVAFIDVHVILNSDNPNWVRPLDQDINSTFDPKQNRLFKDGKAKRWLLIDDKGNLSGRIAAYVNPSYKNKGDKQLTGGVGYFDCINDQEAANLLFDIAKEWLSSEGMEAMDGPINFGERNKFWGLLVDGFHPPVYNLSFNPPYYAELFTGYGFQKFYSQYCYDNGLYRDKPRQLADKFYEGHSKYANNPDYYIKHLSKNNIREFSADFSEVYNQAWAGHEGNKVLSKEAAYRGMKKMKPILKKHTAWLAYHKERPVAVWLNMVNLNEIFKDFNGKMNLLNKLRFLYRINFKKLTQLVGLVYGVIPEYQGTGMDYFLIVETEKDLKVNTHFVQLELQWIGDFNPKMMAIAEFLDSVKSRELITYRYLFDREAKYERHPIFG